MKLLIIFVLLNVVNVIIQTIKSIITIKGGKGISAIVNALAYGFYTVVIIYMVCDLSTTTKALIVGLVNLIGVYLVKWFEEKLQKDKLWKIELTVPKIAKNELSAELEKFGISHNYIDNIGKYTLFNCYAPTQKDSQFVKDLAKRYKAKFFAIETKNL